LLIKRVAGSTLGQNAIEWLALRWETVCGQLNHFCIYQHQGQQVNSAFIPSG